MLEVAEDVKEQEAFTGAEMIVVEGREMEGVGEGWNWIGMKGAVERWGGLCNKSTRWLRLVFAEVVDCGDMNLMNKID